ncbi:MAG: hypothetical protein D6709_09280 [Chloroflexi bacterium]|uniref:Metallo-beta-lactamase domain-containing protein n=1 Tax=Candidatus Thermofonsia Clade 3 bacterium TaxID=2364212 RepID=A0A2M8QBY8_9CHLR|nr:MAG: hypothetical protein CUN48_09265 [Candidatus Thermofonsia Clade 3 bacterium]RMG63182.1 MAG: hypothetical protein D6709_09280 [Chloroflexota bacterium]
MIGEDAVVCVDLPPDPSEARAWRAQVAELSDKPIRAVVFTASDRMSAESLAAVGAPTAVVHDAALAPSVVQAEPAPAQPFESPPSVARGCNDAPQLTFSDSISIVLGMKHVTFVDVTFQGGYSPDACFVTVRDSGIVFAGDHVAVGQPPHLAQANLERWLAVLAALKKTRTITTLVPGRGPAGEPAEAVDATLDYIKAATVRVRALARARRSRSEVGALVPDLMMLYAPKIARSKASPAYDVLAHEMRAGLERLYDELQTKGE